MAALVQVVVSNAVVVAVHDANDDIYDVYDHATHAWFDYEEVLNFLEEVTVSSFEETQDSDGVTIVTPVERTTTQPKLDIPDPRLAMTLSEAKAAVISQLTRITNHEILAEYPVQKQLDINRQISGYTAQNRTDMDTFIAGKYTTLATKTAAVNALGTVAAVIAYDVWA